MLAIDKKAMLGRYGDSHNVYHKIIKEAVMKEPAIIIDDSIVSILHCSDCRFWDRQHVSCEGLAKCQTGESGIRYRTSHDFCSRAQALEECRKEERCTV